MSVHWLHASFHAEMPPTNATTSAIQDFPTLDTPRRQGCLASLIWLSSSLSIEAFVILCANIGVVLFQYL